MFAYIMVAALALLSAYVMSVSTVEPPLEHYDVKEEDLTKEEVTDSVQ